MKTAKPPAPEGSASSSRRAQPVRQTRTNPPRTSSLNRGNSLPGAPAQEQPIDVFPAITHFADAITALPKDLVRHFTLLKEVDAKTSAPEATLFELLDAALKAPIPDPVRLANDVSTPTSAALSAHNSTAGIVSNANPAVAPSNDGSVNTAAFDPSNIPRRQLFRHTACEIKDMLMSLDEKNHVISTANDALQKHLGRIEEIWPHLENSFSDEAKWGSTTHWAYVENRVSKAANAQAERSRREGAATLSAAAQQLAEEAAARSSDRKQALAAKKNSKAQAAETDGDGKSHDAPKKSQGNAKSRKAPADAAASVGLGISNATTGATPAPKRRKVATERKAAEATNTAPTDRAMASVYGGSAPKPKPTSPRETPAPEGTTKKRKALPTSSGQAKKSRTNAAMLPSVASSPVVGTFPDTVKIGRDSPVPLPPRPTSSRARQSSAQANSNTEIPRQRPPSVTSNKPNGVVAATPDQNAQSNGSKPATETKASKDNASVAPVKSETAKPEGEIAPAASAEPPTLNVGTSKKESVTAKIPEDKEAKREQATPILPPTPLMGTVKTKSGRASKPSTPALATFAEAAAASLSSRSRPSRNPEGGGSNGATGSVTAASITSAKRSHKKGASVSAAATSATAGAIQAAAHGGGPSGGEDSRRRNNTRDDDDDDEPDADEPRYCICNQVSYGEMVGCDADDCPREWFHLECVGLDVAPKGKTKWYCDDCKKRLRIGERTAR